MAILRRRGVEDSLKRAEEMPMSSDSGKTSWGQDDGEAEKEEDDEQEPTQPRTRQARTRGKNRSKQKGFSVLRYRVQDFKQQSPLSPDHEFDSSLRTLRFDPATLCISELTDPHVKAVIHKTTTFFWPSFRVYAETDIVDPWLEQMCKSTVLYHSVLAGHGALMKAYNNNSSTQRTDVFIQRSAIAAMREMRHLAEKQEQATDEMLIAASYLSMTPRPRSDRYGRVGGLGFGLFTPPLQKLQAIDCHGWMYFADPHRSAVLLMIKQRGGLKEVQAIGIAEGLQCYDLHSSAQALEPPTLELAHSAEHFICAFLEPERRSWQAARRKDTSDRSSHEFSFDGLDISTELMDILVDMRVYSGHVHSFVSGDPAPSPSEMAMFRNMIHFRLLLKLPEVTPLPSVVATHAVQREITSASRRLVIEELTQLGALLFSYGVLYPSPPWDAKRKLLEMLLARLKAVVLGGFDHWSSRDEIALLLWLAMLGCLMAVGPDVTHEDAGVVGRGTMRMTTSTTHEFPIGDAAGGLGGDIFFSLLAWCRARLALNGYGELKRELQRWLWLDEACEEGARRVWGELVRFQGMGNVTATLRLDSSIIYDS